MLIVVLTSSNSIMASKASTILIFGVVDEISREDLLSDVAFELRCNDSIIVPIDSVSLRNSTYILKFSGPNGNYALWADKDGYNSGCVRFLKSGDRYGNKGLGDIELRKERVKKLNEVTVEGTHIKMVMRGDTIVYDAAAFELAEGSMLDALVSQLPGAELHDGQITVNGKRVSSLLVNGEDFFSGNPKIALQNLPSYTVKNIKVYDRASRDSYLRGGKTEFDSENIVMDVNLKKQYSYGFIGNIDAAYGLQDRYLAKGFGLGYRDGLRIAGYVNFNNIKDTSAANTGGGWGSGWGQDGRLSVKMGGVDYLWKKSDFRFAGNVMLTGEDTDVRTMNSTQSFYESGDVYGRSSNVKADSKFHLVSSHEWSWSGETVYAEFTPAVDYLTNNYSTITRRASFSTPVIEQYRGEALDSLFSASAQQFTEHMLSKVSNSTNGKSDWIIANAKASTTIQIPGQLDQLKLYAGGKYRKDTDDSATQIGQTYGQESSDYGKSITTDQDSWLRSKAWDATAGVQYEWWYRPSIEKSAVSAVITPQFEYQHSWLDKEKVLRQLQQEEFGSTSAPSAHMQELLPLDLNNSFNSTLNQNFYTPTITFNYGYLPDINTMRDQLQVELSIADRIAQESLHYRKAESDTSFSRLSHSLSPRIEFAYKRSTATSRSEYQLGYFFSQAMPSILYSLNNVDTSSPTNVYLNNPNLKKSLTHAVNFSYNQFWNQTHRSLNAKARYSHTNRSIAQARYYDRNSGVSTWRPENVDGNWEVGGNVGYTIPFGAREAFQFSGNTSASYNNSVDYATTTDVLSLSTVHNTVLSQQAGISYRSGRVAAGVTGSVAWQRARSVESFFETISAFSYNARANLTLNLAYNWELATDLNLYARRGYSDSTLNTTDWIWNASISKTLLRGNLVVKAEAVDLLAQVSQVRNVINAQGRTETWVNSLPRYALLHLIYRLNIIPKRK
jgi:hypothetical protein